MGNHKITYEMLHPSIVDDINRNTTGDLSGLETPVKDSIVGAINSLNNEYMQSKIGKEKIAGAIGEPLSKDDSIDEMVSDINGLLINFKNNLMVNGVAVESGDKFQEMIEKIKTLSDNGDNGLQYVGGTINATGSSEALITRSYSELGVNFNPSWFIIMETAHSLIAERNMQYDSAHRYYSSLTGYYVHFSDLTDTGFSIKIGRENVAVTTNYNIQFFAIGVGENKPGQVVTPSTEDQVLEAGTYSGNIVVPGDADLKPENIKEGVEIFGVTGTSKPSDITPDVVYIFKRDEGTDANLTGGLYAMRSYKGSAGVGTNKLTVGGTSASIGVYEYGKVRSVEMFSIKGYTKMIVTYKGNSSSIGLYREIESSTGTSNQVTTTQTSCGSLSLPDSSSSESTVEIPITDDVWLCRFQLSHTAASYNSYTGTEVFEVRLEK